MGIPAARGGWREAVQRLPPEHGVECGRAQIWEKYVSAMFSKLMSVTKAGASCSGALVEGLSLVELTSVGIFSGSLTRGCPHSDIVGLDSRSVGFDSTTMSESLQVSSDSSHKCSAEVLLECEELRVYHMGVPLSRFLAVTLFLRHSVFFQAKSKKRGK